MEVQEPFRYKGIAQIGELTKRDSTQTLRRMALGYFVLEPFSFGFAFQGQGIKIFLMIFRCPKIADPLGFRFGGLYFGYLANK